MRSGLTVLAGTLALVFPAGAVAHGAPDGSHGAGHGKSAQLQNKPVGHGQGGAHRHIPMVAIVAKGTVVSVDPATSSAVVQITRANHHGAGLVGMQVTIDLSKTRISVADANGDGQKNLADVAVGDHVLVWGRIPLHGSLAGALSAGRLIDQTHPAGSDPSSSTQATSTT